MQTNCVNGESSGTYPGHFWSNSQHLEALIARHVGFTPYRNVTVTNHIQFCNSNHLCIVMYLICGIHFISVSLVLHFSETLVYVYLTLFDSIQNFTFVIQNEIHNFHWSNPQAALQPYVFYLYERWYDLLQDLMCHKWQLAPWYCFWVEFSKVGLLWWIS